MRCVGCESNAHVRFVGSENNAHMRCVGCECNAYMQFVHLIRHPRFFGCHVVWNDLPPDAMPCSLSFFYCVFDV